MLSSMNCVQGGICVQITEGNKCLQYELPTLPFSYYYYY